MVLTLLVGLLELLAQGLISYHCPLLFVLNS